VAGKNFDLTFQCRTASKKRSRQRSEGNMSAAQPDSSVLGRINLLVEEEDRLYGKARGLRVIRSVFIQP
jgi:hypothetical protein